MCPPKSRLFHPLLDRIRQCKYQQAILSRPEARSSDSAPRLPGPVPEALTGDLGGPARSKRPHRTEYEAAAARRSRRPKGGGGRPAVNPPCLQRQLRSARTTTLIPSWRSHTGSSMMGRILSMTRVRSRRAWRGFKQRPTAAGCHLRPAGHGCQQRCCCRTAAAG